MALDLDVFEADLTAIIADMPAVLVFGAVTANVTRSGGTESHDVQLAGFIEDYDEEFMGKIADFSPLPIAGDQVTIDGTAVKVVRQFQAADGKGFHLWVQKI